MKKRLLSLLIIFSLVFGFIPFGEIKSYGQASNKVRIRVEGRDKTLYDRMVTVTDSVYCEDYLKLLDDSKISNGWITTLLGETPDSSNNETWMNYYVKDNEIDTSKGVHQYKLNNIDEAVIYVAKYNSDWSEQKTLIPIIDVEKDGEQVQLTVYGKSWNESNPYSGADLKISYIGNETTDSDGKSSIDLKGIHKVEIGDYPNLVRKTIYVGEKDVIEEVKSRIDSFKNYYNNNTENLNSDAAPIYYAVSENDEEIKMVKDNYTYEISEDSGVGNYAKHIIALLAKQEESSIIDECVQVLKNSQQSNGKFIKENSDDYITNQVFCVLALDLVEESYDINKAIQVLMSQQNDDGSFGLYKDIDTTAMVLLALSNHRDINGVNDAIDSALEYIKKNQLDTGGFEAWGSESPSTIAWVIKALVALDKNPLSDYWSKNGNTMLDALMKFKQSDILNDKFSRNDVFSALVDLYNGESMYKNLVPHIHEDYKMDTGNDIEEPEYDFELKRNGYSDFQRGSEAQLNVDVTNNTDTDKTVTYIVALYKLNGDNKELYTYTFVTKTINAGVTEEFAGGFLIPASGEYEVKAMLWDDFENGTSLAKEIKVDVE